MAGGGGGGGRGGDADMIPLLYCAAASCSRPAWTYIKTCTSLNNFKKALNARMPFYAVFQLIF